MSRLLTLPLMATLLFLTGCVIMPPPGLQWPGTPPMEQGSRVVYVSYETQASLMSEIDTDHDCQPYTIPPTPEFPPIPVITARQAAYHDKVEEILVRHIAELRSYVRLYLDEIEDAYRVYRDACV